MLPIKNILDSLRVDVLAGRLSCARLPSSCAARAGRTSLTKKRPGGCCA